MKYKNILNIALVLVVGLLFAACSQSDDATTSSTAVKMQNGLYVYENIDFNCQPPGYDEGTTRAVSYNWQYGVSLFARFKSGSTYYQGFLTRTEKGWSLASTDAFLGLTTSGTCELYYFQEANGDYYSLNIQTQCFDVYNNGSYVKSTDIRWDTDSLSLSEGTAVYSTATATYTTKAGGACSVEATLKPLMWRMRFSGSNGTTITLPSIGNDIMYCTSFNWSPSSVSFSLAPKDVTLEVSGGYTPYIYGDFNSTESNQIAVQNGGDIYSRNLNASSLPVGTSGYFDIPTASNYSNKGWRKGYPPVSGESWTWDYDGVSRIWGSMGYCGGSGAEVGVNHNGEWWGAYNEDDLLRQLSSYSEGKAHGDESMNAYFTLANNGIIGRYAGDGTEINRGFYYFDNSVANEWKVADMFTTPGTILFPYEINSNGNMPGIFEVVYMTDDRMCLVYPEGGNFSSLGNWGAATFWHFRKAGTSTDIDVNATIRPDLFVSFTDGMVTSWSFGNTADTFIYKVYTPSEAAALTDDEMAARLLENGTYSRAEYGDYIFSYTNSASSSTFSPDTRYYLCAVAKNSSGKRGPVLRYSFWTNSEGLPYAEVSDVTASETNKWSCQVTLKNDAQSYYVAASTNENTYNSDWHFVAYRLRRSIASGEEEAIDWPRVTWTLNSGTCKYITITTWGADKDGYTGNPYVAYGNVSSSAPVWKQKASKSAAQQKFISKKELEDMLKGARLYRVTR